MDEEEEEEERRGGMRGGSVERAWRKNIMEGKG